MSESPPVPADDTLTRGDPIRREVGDLPQPPTGEYSSPLLTQHAVGSGRVRRLALKELRETLRDRRTLLTLVLMPCLLYPLLSMVLHKFLPAGPAANTLPDIKLGYSEEDGVWLRPLIAQARELLARRRTDPMPALNTYTVHDIEQAVRHREVDIALRVTRLPSGNEQTGGSWELDCELLRLEDWLYGERAARHVEDCMRALGSRIIGIRLRAAGVVQRSTPIRMVERRIEDASPTSLISLPALIPFVLILMTITGAVYPAIDLTAGERERGTLELLIAAPVPRLTLLFAKYVAVLTVAVLTAGINLLAMTGTIAFTPSLRLMLWGEQGISIGTVAAVFFLLLLLASLFAALLLTITSFARSFKEAQAYLIPVMLCALGPGLISLMPGVELESWVAVMPLLNVALLSRDILNGNGSVLMGAVVVISTALYAFAALALAARLFAAEAVVYDARLGWNEMWRRPRSPAPAGVAMALLCLACMFPISFAANGTIASLDNVELGAKLIAMIVATAIVYGGVPLVFGYWRRVPWDTGFYWRAPTLATCIGAAWLGFFLWPLAHEIIVTSHALGIVSLRPEQLKGAQAFIDQARALPLWLVLAAVAIAPAVFEEFCFRGFVLGAFRSRMKAWTAILASALLFGVFHMVTTYTLAVERLLPSFFLGVVLGWVCYRTNSLFPGMLLHACHNGLLILLSYYLPQIKAAGWGVEERSHLPWTWLAVAALGALVGWAVLYFSTRGLRWRSLPAATTTTASGGR